MTATTTEHEKPQLSKSRELIVAVAIVLTQFVQMIPFGAGITAAVAIGKDLGADQYASAWIAASYPLTQGAYVLMGGRLGQIYGHKNVLMVAGVWWVILTLVSGFTRNLIALCTLRGLTGIGGAFMLPNSLALLTITFPPGRMRNITVSLFGAMAPVGAAGGSIWPGLFVQLTPWKYLFIFLSLLGAVIFTVFFFVVPSEGEPFDKGAALDWVGAYLGTTGLVLFNFVWNQAPSVGWDEPYEYALLFVSVLHLAGFIIWERNIAKVPILPFDIWTAPSFAPMIAAAFITFMAVGVVIWYISIWEYQIRGYTLLLLGASYSTLAVCGAGAAFASGKAIRILPAQYIMVIGAVATAVSNILLATMPAHQTYWAQVFPALICLAFGPDFIFTAAQIIASNAVKRRHQGIAGSLVGTVASYGMSTGLGVASTVEVYTNGHGKKQIQGFRHALYLGVGMASLAAIIALMSVRIPKDTREGWDEDDDPDPRPEETRAEVTQ
ncbi:major facilitator superfamily domain-containing protein [Exophiala viscosa]|uniref:Major facilitator superfamily domain-containing protein n=1 Tax=Exophiala viscosa TaxID=2486360 RepID=A0AAN6DNS6_9EURO|nr:major facilitator superfamily domain-containing protein [Exophiala viscosa]KAI1620206.1 major facilitator superfamily domain-containing protein [Exophiala viscosa]